MARKTRLISQIVGPDQLAVWAALEERYRDVKGVKTRARVVATFREFCALNGFALSSRALKLWVGSMIGQCTLKIGTCHSYINYVHRAMRWAVPTWDRPEWTAVVAVVAMAHADGETRKAPEVTMVDALRVISRLVGDVAVVVSAITISGARCGDVMRWQPQRAQFWPNAFRVTVCVAKNRRDPDKRVIHRVDDVVSLLGVQVPVCLQRLGEYPAGTRPFAPWHAIRVNSAIARACTELKLPRLTTYSFRRLYCRLVLKSVGYDPEKAKRLTLHCRAEVLAAYYDH